MTTLRTPHLIAILGALVGLSTLACLADPEAEQSCERTDARICDPNTPNRVFWKDSCGKASEIAESCLGEAVCQTISATAADCGLPSDCLRTETLACDPAQPNTIFVLDTCGQAQVAERCLGDGRCVATAAGQAKCEAQNCALTTSTGCDPEQPNKVFVLDECGNPRNIAESCLGKFVCTALSDTQADCACPLAVPQRLGCAAEGAQKIDNPTEIGPLNVCDQIVEITQTCMMGERCWYEFNAQGEAISDPFCATSINPRHRAEPFYGMGCDNDIYMAAQTDLSIDCRCNRSNMSLQECRPAPDAWNFGLRKGAGPHTRGINLQKWGGGFISKASKELFAVVQYTGGQVGIKPGALYAFNYETGDRRVVSGSYEDDTGRHDVGGGYTPDGEALPFAVSAKLGADGNIYVAGSDTLNHVEITRVNPTTGDRELVWRRQTDAEGLDPNFAYGQCWSGRVSQNYIGGFAPVQNAERAFALAPDGGFYLAWKNDGVGVVHISKDGKTCKIISRWASNNSTAPLPNIGGGVSPQYGTISGMLHHNGKIYAETKDALIAVDDTTGDRTYFANVSGIGGVGETNFFIDPTRELFFACGTVSSRKCSVHRLADGNQAQGLFQIGQGQPIIPGKYPQTQGAKGALDNNNYTGFGAVALDPDDPNVLYFIVDYAMVKYEIDTGNSYILSI